MLFSLLSWNENQAKLSVPFKLQVGKKWTKLAEIWPAYCQIVILKNSVCEFWFLFSVFSYSIFSTGNTNELLSLTLLLKTKEQMHFTKICLLDSF